jgi:tetratricopeptide (TPR) repeat protein
MTSTPATSLRLVRLESYLRQDPDNPSLLGDTFEVALQAGELARAELHLQHAQSLGVAQQQWGLHEAHLRLAQHRWSDAELCLQRLMAGEDVPAELRAVLAHDLAYVALRRGDFENGVAQLAPLVEASLPTKPLDAASQALWLRLLHRVQRHEQAMAWAVARWDAKNLAAGAAGVASLIALDANDAPRSLLWAEYALKHEGQQLEALVSRATLALGQDNPALARQLLEQALQHDAADGRILSALAFTDLVQRRFDEARANFNLAVKDMPGHIGTWHGLGWTLLLLNDLPGAHQAFETALALDRSFSENHGALAIILALLQRKSEAEQAIERALRLDRSCVSASYAEAILSGEADDPRAIRRLATRLLGGRPGMLGGTLLEAVVQAAPVRHAQERQDAEAPPNT